MALPQQKMREIVFQLLYMQEFLTQDVEDSIDLVMNNLLVTKKSVHSALEKSRLVLENKIDIDNMIRKASVSYDFERIAFIEKNILRLALFEIFIEKQVPAKVAISEAIRLSRKFATPEAGNYVNAVLDALYQISLSTEPVVSEPLAFQPSESEPAAHS